MLAQRLVLVGLFRERQFQHDLPVGGKGLKLFGDLGQQDVFGFRLVSDRDRHFRLDDRHQAMTQDLAADIELLGNNGGDAFRIGRMDDRAHLGAENALGHSPLKQGVEVRHRLHHLDAVSLVHQALVDLEEGHDFALLPEVFSCRDSVDIAFHRAFEQDGAHHLVALEGR